MCAHTSDKCLKVKYYFSLIMHYYYVTWTSLFLNVCKSINTSEYICIYIYPPECKSLLDTSWFPIIWFFNKRTILRYQKDITVYAISFTSCMYNVHKPNWPLYVKCLYTDLRCTTHYLYFLRQRHLPVIMSIKLIYYRLYVGSS